jgi:hypothetical protein
MRGKRFVPNSFLVLLCSVFLFATPVLGLFTPSPTAYPQTTVSGVYPFLSEMLIQVNESQLRSYVHTIQEFGPHPTKSPAIDAIRDYLYNTLASMNISVRYDPWHEKRASGKNIIATLPGAIMVNTSVILCAHYDSIAISTWCGR